MQQMPSVFHRGAAHSGHRGPCGTDEKALQSYIVGLKLIPTSSDPF